MRFLNFGSCNVDYVYSLDHIVRGGETLSSEGLNIFPGGKGLNQSIALSRAGAEVYHAGCIGSGGELLLDTLTENGVDVSYVRRVDAMNGHAIIQVSRDAENSIFLYAGSNEMITEEQADSVLADFGNGDMLVLQNEINCLEYIIDAARARGMQILLNPSPINEKILSLDLTKLSYIILNEGEMKDITGEEEVDAGLRYFAEKYPELAVMLTLGKNGCVYQDKTLREYHPIFETNAVDTTAAGDTFTGYFAAGLARGDKISEILRLASCAAAISVSRHGAAPSIPTRSEVVSLIDTMRTKESVGKNDRLKKETEAYIAANLTGATLEGLASMLGYSSVYAGTLVSRLFGMTFKALLVERRLQIAARLLKETELPVSEIIKQVGYENEGYFRDKFKEKYGKRPLEYRKEKGI